MIFHVVATDKCSQLILLYWFVSSFVFCFWSLSDLQTSNQVAQVVQIFYYGIHMWLTRRFSVYSRTISRAWKGYLETLWGGTGGALPEPSSMTSSSLLVWMFDSLVGGQWWSGEEYQANGTLTAVMYWYEILRAIIRPYTGSLAPGFLSSCAHSVCAVSGWRRNWCHWLALMFPKPESNWKPLRHYVSDHSKPPSNTTHFPRSYSCSEQGLGGDQPWSLSSLLTFAYRYLGTIHTSALNCMMKFLQI